MLALLFRCSRVCVIFACNSGSEEQNPNYDANLASMKAMFDGFQSKTINPDLFAEIKDKFQEEDRTKDVHATVEDDDYTSRMLNL